MSEQDARPAGAAELAARIRAGELTSEAAVTACLERIGAANPRLHAVVRLAPEALEEARAADRQRRAGSVLGPLHGVPFTVKDWIETRGLVCDAGDAALRDHVPAQDATAVRRLRAAGAILLGKTRVGVDGDLHPVPRNPWDPARTPGASSSGEAAIIAVGASPLGLGSDSGGSLRWPAHCCGIQTLKPTSGRVPLTGHLPRIVALTDPRTVIGPMARSVDDLALALALISGSDGRDASVVPMPVPRPLPDARPAPDLRGLRVARFDAFAGAEADSPTRRVVADAAAALQAAGATVEAACPPRIADAMRITQAYWRRPESTSLDHWQPWGESRLSADEVERSLFEWDRLRRAFTEFMAHHDLILCPVAAGAAPPAGAARAEDYAFTLPFSLTGQPVVVIRAGTDGAGLPIGVQLAAGSFRERHALAAARVLELALGPWPLPAMP
ncbi:MAG TPA: amidase [Pseudomonadales bacterium]|nr:amidase [Pseudomonadales bacterium]